MENNMYSDFVQMVDTNYKDSTWKLGLASSSEESAMHVDRILGKKIIPSESNDPLYFIKWKGRSHIHCSWERSEDIEAVDPQGRIKIIKYNINTPDSATIYPDYFEFFDPELCIVSRILACSRRQTFISNLPSADAIEAAVQAHTSSPSDIENSTLYLIKWKSLPYAEATWERFDDISNNYLELYKYWSYHQVTPLLAADLIGLDAKRLSDEVILPGVELLDFQRSGIYWLVQNQLNSQSCILNDDYGSGKILQLIGFIKLLFEQKINSYNGPVLILMSAYRFNHWLYNLEKYLPKVTVLHYYGREKERELMRKLDISTDKSFKFEVLVTSFETATRDFSMLKSTPWRCIIVDEAHRFRNVHSKLHTQLCKLSAPQIVFSTNVPFTKLEDIWSLFKFVNAEKYAHAESFTADYKRVVSNTTDNGSVVDAIILRRRKSVMTNQTVIALPLPLLPSQETVMRHIIEDGSCSIIGDGSSEREMKKVINELLLCCAHPLLTPVQFKRIGEDESSQGLFDHSLKLTALNILMGRLVKDNDKKIVICSQFQQVIDVLDMYLKSAQLLYERIDALMTFPERSAASLRFGKELYERSVLLLSIQQSPQQVIDLSCADVIIFFDNDPMHDWMRLVCSYKIGFHKQISIYRLVCQDSIESILIRHNMEQFTDINVPSSYISDPEGSASTTTHTLPDAVHRLKAPSVETILRKAAYHCCLVKNSIPFRFDEVRGIADYSCSNPVFNNLESLDSIVSNCSYPDLMSSENYWSDSIGLIVTESKIGKNSRKRKAKQDIGEDEDEDTVAAGTKKKGKKAPIKPVADVEVENATTAPSFQWGVRNRDKIINCLNLYGFGRWSKILKMSALKISAGELDMFCKAYILKCSYIASEMPQQDIDTVFVKEAIRAAMEVKVQEDAGKILIPCPEVLQDDKLTHRLKHKSSAKRIITSLGVMMRLERIIESACFICLQKQKRTNGYEDVDEMLNDLDVTDICENMSIPAVHQKQKFHKRTPWWTPECDRHLLLGVYTHGYGRFDLIKKDSKLIFCGMLEKLAASAAAEIAPDSSQGEGPDSDVGLYSVESIPEAKNDEDENIVENISSIEINRRSSVKSEDSSDIATASDSQRIDESVIKEKDNKVDCGDAILPDDDLLADDDNGDEGAARGDSADGMPDTRFLNKLVYLLVCPDFVPEIPASQSSVPSPIPVPVSQVPSKASLQSIKPQLPKPQTKDLQDQPKRRPSNNLPSSSDQYPSPRELNSHNASSSSLKRVSDQNSNSAVKQIHEEGYLLASLPEILDQQAINLCFSLNTYQLCKDVMLKSISNNEPSEGLKNEYTQGLRIVLDEEEISKICSGLILFGAPFVLDSGSIISSLDSLEGVSCLYDWRRFIHISNSALQPKHIRHFYETCWLPFCSAISNRDVRFTNKRILPNPLVKPSDHSLVTRGLCQMFLARQRLLRIIFYSVTEAKALLIATLKDLPFMPTELTPWWTSPIHDIALFNGCLSYGYMAVDEMRADSKHCFHHIKLAEYLRILNSSRLSDAITLQFPTHEAIERRLLAILEKISTELGSSLLNQIFASVSKFPPISYSHLEASVATAPYSDKYLR